MLQRKSVVDTIFFKDLKTNDMRNRYKHSWILYILLLISGAAFAELHPHHGIGKKDMSDIYPSVDSIYAPAAELTHTELQKVIFSTIIPAFKERAKDECRIKLIFGKRDSVAGFVPLEIALSESNSLKDMTLLGDIRNGECFVEQRDGIPVFYIDKDSTARRAGLLKITSDSTLLNPYKWTYIGTGAPIVTHWYLEVYNDSLLLDWYYGEGLLPLEDVCDGAFMSMKKSKAYVERMNRRQDSEQSISLPKTINNSLR